LGNAFSVFGFLDYIEAEGLLALGIESPPLWAFDVEAIKQETMLVDAIADVLSRKIHRLSSEEHATMKIASLLGYRFEIATLAKVLSLSCISTDDTQLGHSLDYEEAVTSVRSTLEKAVHNGLIRTPGMDINFATTSSNPPLHQ
jgi:predicted ATPase